MIKLLTFTTLFPNASAPRHGVFVKNRLRYLLESGEVESKVVAPIPWFPLKNKCFGEYSQFAKVPVVDTCEGIDVFHPRYLLIPKIGMNYTPYLMAKAVLPLVKRIISDGYDFDVIDAHYFYPDGVAAKIVGKILNKPVVITARGTDLNLIPQYDNPRQQILKTAGQVSAMITVCQALKDVLLDMGVDDERVTVLRNGVDLQMFQPPKDKDLVRSELNLKGKVILSVGHLIERKGHDLVIKALLLLPDTTLLIAGDGEEHNNLVALTESLGLSDRVTFLGAVPHATLKKYYGAVGALVLASSREGWANVLLESLACGTPVVATNLWGTPEVISTPEAGVLSKERTPESLAEALNQLFTNYPDSAASRKYAEQFSWDATTQGQLELFKRVIKA